MLLFIGFILDTVDLALRNLFESKNSSAAALGAPHQSAQAGWSSWLKLVPYVENVCLHTNLYYTCPG